MPLRKFINLMENENVSNSCHVAGVEGNCRGSRAEEKEKQQHPHAAVNEMSERPEGWKSLV